MNLDTNKTPIGLVRNSGVNMQEMIDKVVGEADDFIMALESVGAMYGIPSTHIICDDTQRGIKVKDDMIIASSTPNPSANTKSIVCAVGGVLDNISKRIDDKVTDFQQRNIEQSKTDAVINKMANPSKGKIIATYKDGDGNPIIVYDSGLVDMANTKTAHAKYDELKQDLKIPMYNPDAMKRDVDYFSDEDDISADIGGADPGAGPEPMETTTTESFSDVLGDDEKYLDIVAAMHDTTYLGHDLLQEQGFDFVKKTNRFYSESDSKKKTINPEDIKHMKFDNKNLLKAIRYFNDARAEQGANKNRGMFSIKEFINSENYQKAIDCLDKQFNCRLNIRYFQINKPGTTLYTNMYNDIKNNLSISKSKGFQLNGLPVQIMVVNKAIDEEAADGDISMFGQFITAGILHELFHNIMCVIRMENVKYKTTLIAAMTCASNEPNAKNRRKIIESYVDTLDIHFGKIMNRIMKRRMTKELLAASTARYNQQLLSKIQNDSSTTEGEKEIDALINQYSTIIKKYEKRHKPVAKFFSVIGIIVGAVLSPVIIGVPLLLFCSSVFAEEQMMNEYKNNKDHEEMWCDMFAAMYQIPLTFLIGPWKHRVYVPNELREDQLKKLSGLEIKVHEIMMDVHPSFAERNYMAVKLAQQLLDSDEKLEPEIKKYCEWIVDNYSNMKNTDVESIYNNTTFDPKESDDLDVHIQQLIDKNGITVTESARLIKR